MKKNFGAGQWIGVGSYIGKRVVIEERFVIGAHSVVVKNIPPDSLAVGKPARVIKKLEKSLPEISIGVDNCMKDKQGLINYEIPN